MNIGAIIPQIFYDLIARITPGIVVILAGLFVWFGQGVPKQTIVGMLDWLGKENSPVLLVLFFFLLCAYILAFLLDGVWGFLPRKFFQDEQESYHDEILTDFKKSNSEFDESNYRFPGVALRYDAVRLRDANAGARLAKLRAELHMLRILVIGLSIVSVLNIKNLFPSPNARAIITQTIIVVAVYSFRNTHDRLKDRFIWGTCNHWLLLVHPGLPAGAGAEQKESSKAAGGAQYTSRPNPD